MSHLLWYPGHELLLSNIVRAEGCHLYAADGRRYVDLESGVWCTALGHGHPRLLQVLVEQAGRLAHTGFGYSTAVVEEAAEEILSLLGFAAGRCVFLAAGSEAVEYGVRTAQLILERPRLLTMKDSYFGAYGSASRNQEDEWFSFDWLAHTASPDTGVSTIPFADLGGFLFEPGSSSGLVRFPPESLIQEIVTRMRERRGLVLVNEVTTGVGRTGTWFGYQHYGISPDVVTLGKGLGNGYPVSVAAFAPGVIERLGGTPLRYAQSHQNDPLGAVVAREVLRIIRDEDLLARGRSIGALLLAGLEEIKARSGRIREIRARGLMLAVELEDDAETSRTIHLHRELVRRGFVTGRRPGVSVLRLDPPLTIDRADIEDFLAALGDLLDR